ncbi:MAG: tRNA (adenosine(37)-N6)-threonylcarbamoyltransferase complex transferase subunit TsaD [Pseudomonadota bacterium]
MKVLAIETSCDDTSVAIIDDSKNIITNKIFSQHSYHQQYGGVIPEIASRAHIEHITKLIKDAIDDAQLNYNELDAVAATIGPGLIGSLIVGVMAAKAIAHSYNLKFIGVNHLEGHALTARLTGSVDYPFLLFLLSGGHCQALIVENVGQYKLLGKTLDDSLGEAFDKVAKMLNLGYPGGPIIEEKAKYGDPKRFALPIPLKNTADCNFSLSGLKTAVKKYIDEFSNPLQDRDINDICASFQYVVGKLLQLKLSYAIKEFSKIHPYSKNFVLAGGVAANQYIREQILITLKQYQFNLHVPPISLCTDNAAMIGWAAIENLQLNKQDSLDIKPRARWNLYD